MNPRVEFLSSKLTEYLDRRTMPRGLQSAEAQKKETQALIHCLVRYAPRQEFGEWWGKLEVTLDEAAETRAWPTVAEIRKAAMVIRGPGSKHVAEVGDIDPLAIIAERINAGDLVGDGYLYGRLAVDLQRRGLVTVDTLRKYRSALYFRLKNTYGEDRAREMEARFIQRHDDAEAVSNGGGYSAPTPQPKKIPEVSA